MAPRLPKVALKETVLHSKGWLGSGPGSKQTSVAVPKGGLVVSHILNECFFLLPTLRCKVLDIMATHFNRKIWRTGPVLLRAETCMFI